MTRSAAVVTAIVVALTLLAPSAAPRADPAIASEQDGVKGAPASITLRSSAFATDTAIPDRYSAYHEGESPPLEWSGVPARAKALVLLVEDPDAHGAKPFTHWLVADIPPTSRGLPAAIPPTAELTGLPDARQGSTATGLPGYFGPRPPAGDPPHHYHFQLFALDAPLHLSDGFDREVLLDAMRGHVIARGELVGSYQRADRR